MRICLGLGFSLGIFLITNLFFKYRFIQSFYSSVNVIFKEICQFHLSCQICWWKFFYNITYNFLNFCMFDTDIPFFCSHFNNFCPLPFISPFVSVIKHLSILLMFSKNHPLVSLIFLYCFFYLFCFLLDSTYPPATNFCTSFRV